jgi:rhodanese-related sulfurtransferase
MSFLKAVVILATLSTGTYALACPDSDSEQASAVSKVTVADAAKLHKANKIIMVDANSPKTRSKLGVVPGARLLTSYDKFSASELKATKKDTLVFYCYSEACSAAPSAARAAKAKGFKAKVMAAGITGWKKAGHAVKKIKAAPTS